VQTKFLSIIYVINIGICFEFTVLVSYKEK